MQMCMIDYVFSAVHIMFLPSQKLSLLLRICLRHQSVITFFSGASPPKKNPGSVPVLCLLAVREKPNLANLNKIAACGVWAVQVTTLYRITFCCVCIIYLFIYLFFIVSVQFGKKCDPPWRVGRNLISWRDWAPKGRGVGYSTTFIFNIFLCREAPLRGPDPQPFA